MNQSNLALNQVPDLDRWHEYRIETRLNIAHLNEQAGLLFPERLKDYQITILDLSPSGMGGVMDAPLDPGDIVRLKIPITGEEIWAQVCYCHRLELKFKVGFSLTSRCNLYGKLT